MHTTSVESSNLAEAAWADDTLYLRFKKTGAWYSYADVPFDVYTALTSAPSVGEHFHKHIKPAYIAKALTPSEVGHLALAGPTPTSVTCMNEV